ncbi:MAG: AEC family transporter [Planctomycetota bacterium]
MSVLLLVVQTLVPLVVLVAVGAALLRFGFMTDVQRRFLDRLVYWVGLPALLVAKVAEAGSIDASIGWVVMALALATLIAAGLSFLAWRLVSGRHEALGVMVQGGLRGNLAFVGLPVIELAGGGDRALAIGAIAIAPTVTLYNLIAVSALSWGKSAASLSGVALLRQTAWSIVANPLIIACVVGVVLVVGNLRLPDVVMHSLNLVGQPAGPLALMSLGGALVVYRIRGHLAEASVSTVFKLIACPAVAAALVWLLGLNRDEAFALLILAATPTAVASYVLVTQVGGDEGLAASIIALTTLGSVLSLGAAIALAASISA